MSEAKYDGERCLSCAWWVAPANRTLAAPYCACTEKTTAPDFRCDLFVISPQCRIARALDRIADSLGQLCKWKPTLHEDEWAKTRRRPRKPCPECGSEFVEAKFSKLTVPQIGRYGAGAWGWADCVAQCDDCGRNGPEAKGEQAALDAWDKEITGDA